MADFRLISSQVQLTYVAEVDSFVLNPGAVADLALWGGGPNGEALDVRVEDARVVQVTRVDPPARGTIFGRFG